MNKEWSEQNKRMQSLLKKADSFEQGKEVLFELRNGLMNTLLSFKEELGRDDFDAMPFMNADGYHSKNIAYSITGAKKDVRGLIQMPFSRHWIMHIEACLRISGKILK